MKLLKTISILAAITFATNVGFAQEKIGDIVKAGDTAYMLVREFNTPEQNDTFQRNLEIMRRHAKLIDVAKAKLAEEKDESKKSDIAAKLKQIENEFDVNDKAMQKAYAFASNRNYRIIYLESNICAPLTREELSSLTSADGKELDPLKISEKNGVSLYRQCTISGTRENEELQRQIGYSFARKNEIESERQKLSKTTDAQEQLRISQNIVNSEKALQQNEENLRKKYNIKPKSEYVVEIVKSKLYLILTSEELIKIQAQQAVESKQSPAKQTQVSTSSQATADKK